MTLLTEAYTAYLGPLLKKHEEGKYIIWEDLEASYAAMKDVMKSSDNSFVLKRVEDLHKSQVQAYKEAGTKALREWAQTSVPLQPMEENDTEAKFVDRCVSALGSLKRPNWKIDSASMIVTIQIRKHAKTIFAKYNTHHHQKPNSNDNEEEEGEEVEEGEEGEEESGEEDGEEEEEEEGEMGEDGEVEDNDTAAAAATKTSTNKSSLSVKTTKPIKAAAGKQKKAPPPGKGKGVPRKKGTTAKAGNPASRASGRKGGPANRGRRNARGGKSNNNN